MRLRLALLAVLLLPPILRAQVPAAERPVSRVARSIAVEGCPHGVAVRGSVGVITQICGDGIAAFDAGSGKLRARAATPPTPAHVALDPSGTFAWVANQFGGSLSRVRVATGREEVVIPLDGDQGFNVLVSRDGATVWVTTERGWVRAYDTRSAELLASVQLGGAVNGIAESPNECVLFASTIFGGTVYALRRDDLAELRRYRLGATVQRIAVSPDEATLYAANGVRGVAFVDVRSGAVQRVPVGGEALGLALSPGGGWLVATTPHTGEAHVLDARRRRLLRSIAAGADPRNVAIPDGRRAVVADRSGWVRFLE